MNFDPFEQMQRAVDIVNTSPHPDNKIAATLALQAPRGAVISLSRTNFWPPLIEKRLGRNTRIGSSSGTVHAETACLLVARHSAGAHLFVTDPFCPNCAKNVAEAGIKAVYIDHKGFDKDFATRRGDHFNALSMRICEKAGINVFEIRRKEREIRPILQIADGYTPQEDSPVTTEPLSSADDDTFMELVSEARRHHKGRKFAVAIGRDEKNKAYGLVARAHPAIGYSMDEKAPEILVERNDNKQDRADAKYSVMLEPLNRLLMNAPRHGLKLVNGLVFSSGVPTAREQVNFSGAGLTKITVGDILKARDEDAFRAMETMTRNDIITFQEIR